MNKLIQELKREHKALFKILDSFKKGQGIVGNDWKERLFSARELFSSHLKKEDEKLYPNLLKASENNEALMKTVSHFINDMKTVSGLAYRFFDKYKAVSGGTDFIKEFAELEINLKNRIEQEEKVLFKEYENLQSKFNG